MENQDRIQQIHKQLVVVSLVDSFASLLLGLGLYGKFVADGDAFLPLLDNEMLVNGMLIVGAGVMTWGFTRFISLTREKAQLMSEQ